MTFRNPEKERESERERGGRERFRFKDLDRTRTCKIKFWCDLFVEEREYLRVVCCLEKRKPWAHSGINMTKTALNLQNHKSLVSRGHHSLQKPQRLLLERMRRTESSLNVLQLTNCGHSWVALCSKNTPSCNATNLHDVAMHMPSNQLPRYVQLIILCM